MAASRQAWCRRSWEFYIFIWRLLADTGFQAARARVLRPCLQWHTYSNKAAPPNSVTPGPSLYKPSQLCIRSSVLWKEKKKIHRASSFVWHAESHTWTIYIGLTQWSIWSNTQCDLETGDFGIPNILLFSLCDIRIVNLKLQTKVWRCVVFFFFLKVVKLHDP